jgi:hypothetical protein
MKRTVSFFIAVTVVAAAAALLPVVFLEKMELVAEERLDLFASSDQTSQIVGQLMPGSRVWVVGCEDIKHYFVVKVKLGRGQLGHVHKGRFELHRPPSLSAWSAPVAWGCP